MKKNRYPNSLLTRVSIIVSLLSMLVSTHVHASPGNPSDHRKYDNLSTGYSVLKLFLEDEQYLTIVRRTKAVLMFKGISESSQKLIDEIADASDLALEQLENRISLKPAIRIKQFAEDSIAMATLDAMRMTTAREFLFNSDDFEKNLLISQAQILRVISHLARTMAQQEPNHKRRAWLADLADRYEMYYRKVYARLSIRPSRGG